MAMTTIFFLTAIVMVAGTSAQITTLSGTVPCSMTSVTNILNAPIFPNAGVQLRCGTNTVANTTTNANGFFFISLDTTVLTSGCRLVVTTPLINCNATLPATGNLVANLVQSILGLIPLQFTFTA